MRKFLAFTVVAAALGIVALPASGQTVYGLNIGGESSLLGPCTGNTVFGTVIFNSVPLSGTVHCGPAGGTVDSTGSSHPGKLGATLAVNAAGGGGGNSTVSFQTRVVFSSIDPNASQDAIPIALNMAILGQIYAGPPSSNGAWTAILGLDTNNYSFSHSILSGDSALQPNGANSLTFTSGGEAGALAAGTTTDTVSGVLTTPVLPNVGLNTPVVIFVQLTMGGFGNPGSFGGDMTLTCPLGADLFTLPAGYTVNDPDIHLVNNRCLPPALYSWGGNSNGQLGNGATTDSSTPVQVVGPAGSGTLANVLAVSGGTSHSLALTESGAVYAWGDNSAGQLGVGPGTPATDSPVQVPLGPGKAMAIAAGQTHSLVLMDDLTVYSWGGNLNGQPGDGGSSAIQYTPVKVLGPDGITPLGKITAIAAGNGFSAALAADNTIYTWGINLHGQLGNGTASDHVSLPAKVVGAGGTGSLGGVTGISASSMGNHILALTEFDTVYAWGEDHDGELGDGLTGIFSVFPVQVKDVAGTGILGNVRAVAAGGSHSVELDRSYDFVSAWGNNTQNQLGNNSTQGQSIPVQILGPGGVGFLNGISAIQAGGFHSLASPKTGRLLAWGSATHGQLGNGSMAGGSGATPVAVLGPGGIGFLQNVSTFAAGGLHSLAVSTVNPATGTPDLIIAKTHTGNFTPGQQGAIYTISVNNAGNASTSGTVTVNEVPPTGLAIAAMSGAGWDCGAVTSCHRADALPAGTAYPAITVTTNVAANAPSSLTNSAIVFGGGESNTANNSASDLTTIIGGASGDISFIGTNLVTITCPAGVTIVTGNVTIVANLLATLIDCRLLTRVSGNLNISNDPATTVVDVNSLTTVSGNVNVDKDASLTSVELNSLNAVGGNLSVSNDPATTVVDVNSLTTVSGNVNVDKDASVTSVELTSLNAVGGSLSVSNDPAAAVVDVNSLTAVSGNVNVDQDVSLTSVDLASLTTVGGNLSVSKDPATTVVDVNSLTTAGGNVNVDQNASLTSVELSSLNSVGGDLDVSNNATCTAVSLGSLQSVAGNLTVQACGTGTFTPGTASAGGNTTLNGSGFTTVSGTTANGNTIIINGTNEAVMTAQIPPGAFAAPVSFSFTHLDPALLPPVDGSIGGTAATIDPLTAYQVAFGVPTLNQPATLSFLVVVSAFDTTTQSQFLAALDSGLVTLATQSAGAPYQAFPICTVGVLPTVNGCVLAERLDATGQPTTGIPAVVRFSNVVGHFSIWGVAIVRPLVAPNGAGYWKTQRTATESHLPQRLGSYVVDTFARATAVFDNMTCGNSPKNTNDAAGCLAGQLLAAKLNVADGASVCINATAASADGLLIGIHYVGPAGTYQLSDTLRQSAIGLKTALDNYNQGLGCH